VNQGSSSFRTASLASAASESAASPELAVPSAQRASSQRPVVTYALVAVTTAVFAAMVFSQLSPRHPATELLLIGWGANLGPLTIGGQWWRLLTSVFLHIGLLHLAVNMWCLWDLGSFAERIYGRLCFLAVYLISGITGALVSLIWRPFALEAGASGAIFGIAGALIASFCLGRLPYSGKAAKAAILSVVAFAGYNLFVGLFGSAAGVAAHMGGLLSGFVLGLMLARTSLRLTIVVASISIILACGLVKRTKDYVIPAERGRTALAAGQSDQAILAFSESVQKDPKFTEGHSLLGQAYMQKQQPGLAEGAYRRALALQPKANGLRYELAMALLAQGRTGEALSEFNEMAGSDPKSPAAQTGIGTVAEMTGDFPRAFEAFKRAAQLDPRNPQAYVNLGSVALQAHHIDEAIAALSKAAELQPDNPKTLLTLSVAYNAAGRQKEAQDAYGRALELGRKQQHK